MTEMSPLGALILRAMRIGCLLCGGFALLVIVIEIYKRSLAGGLDAMTRQDYTFFGVLCIILLASFYFYRSIGRELAKPGT